MNKTEKTVQDPKKNSRRGFVKWGMLSFLVTALSGWNKTKANSNDGGNKVKMLTSDGRLVEVDQKVLDRVTNRYSVSADEIHNFIEHENNLKK